MGMATTAEAAGGGEREVSIGRVFERAFGTLRANPLATLGIAFLCGALPGAVLGYFIARYQFSLMPRLGVWGVVAFGLLSMLVAVVLYAITQGALVRATVAHSEGRESSFADSIAAGLSVVLPLIVASLLSAIGIGLGMVLLIVPGAMLYCIWAVVAPVVVEERTGPIAALSRSAVLTRGARWKVFGVVLLLLVAYWVFSGVVGGVLIALVGLRGMADAAAMTNGGFPVAFYAVNAVTQTIVSCVWGLVFASLYVELRNWKDGPRTETLAEVFG